MKALYINVSIGSKGDLETPVIKTNNNNNDKIPTGFYIFWPELS